MNTMRIETLTYEDISMRRMIALLTSIESDYIPPLSSLVNISEYAEKLLKGAKVLVAVVGTVDVGAIGFYANNVETRTAFISTIGVLPVERGKNVGTLLIDAAERYCREKRMVNLQLEVSTKNIAALGLYRRLGFVELPGALKSGCYANSVKMEKHL